MKPCHGFDPGSNKSKYKAFTLKVPARAFISSVYKRGPVAQPGRAPDFYRKQGFRTSFDRQSGGRESEYLKGRLSPWGFGSLVRPIIVKNQEGLVEV